MPGMHLVCAWDGGLVSKRSSISGALEALRHDERYRVTTLADGAACFLAHTSYPEYPVQAFHLEDVSVFLEGRLYGLGPRVLQSHLRELALLAFLQDDERDDRVREWLLHSDGDFFVVLVRQATGELRIVNDLLGRLPLYAHVSASGLLVSRELRFVARLLPRLEFDRLAIANFLLSGYVLGRRTWLKTVEAVPPATLIVANPATRETRSLHLHDFNFEQKPFADRDVRDNAAQLADRFGAACEVRARPGVDNVLSLSGGFDSRAIGAAFWNRGIAFRCATFLDHVGNAARDVPIARRLAQLFGAEWTLVQLGPPTRANALRLLRMKNGLNPLGMSFLLPFLESIRQDVGEEISFFSGEPGTFVVPNARPAREFPDVAELARFIARQVAKFSPGTVSALMGLEQAEIFADLEQYLSSFPESDPRQKYVHFVLQERVFRWLTEAEDRNRYYFWSMTPFSSVEFFTYAMGCPDEQKASHALYRELLLRLMPASASVEHAGLGLPITSERFRTASRAAALVGANPEWRERAAGTRGVALGSGDDSLVLRGLHQQLASCDVLGQYVSVPALRAILAKPGSHTPDQLDHLFTVTCIVEDLATGSSVLEQG